MNDNERTPEEITPEDATPEFGADQYIAELNRIRSEMVARSDYDRVVSENSKLARAVADYDYSSDIDSPENNDQIIAALRKNLYGGGKKYRNDLEYFTDTLNLRQRLMDKGEGDPFLPCNSAYVPNEADEVRAQEIAESIQEAVDYADGDPEVFSVEMRRRCNINNSMKRR